MQFVETVLTDEQATIILGALHAVLSDPERFDLEPEERQLWEQLAGFWMGVLLDPSRFAPTGQHAQAVKQLVRRAKGPVQPQSRRNRRKARQEKRMRTAKARRAQRREFAATFNTAMEQLQRDREEAEAAAQEMAQRYAAEPKVDILDGFGNVILAGVPESAIRPHESQDSESQDSESKPHIIMPGTAEALGL